MMLTEICYSPAETFDLGEIACGRLSGGDVILLYGGLGTGKTLLTKGVLHGLGYDVDEVTSPSFAFVNLYKTEGFNVYHIDLWRLKAAADIAAAVGLDEILDDNKAIVIIEWAERLGDASFPNEAIRINIAGDGDEPRNVTIERLDRPVNSTSQKI